MLPIVMYTGQAFLSPERFVRCVASENSMISNAVPPTGISDDRSVSTTLRTVESSYLYFTPPLACVHFIVLPIPSDVFPDGRVDNTAIITGLTEQPLPNVTDISAIKQDRFRVLLVPI